MAEKKQVKLKKTAAGAQQMGSTKDWEATQKRVKKDVDKVHAGTMTRAEFKKKYGKTVLQTTRMLNAAANAASSKDAEKNPEYTGHKKTVDRYEKYWDKQAKVAKKKNYASGGVVKSRTGANDYRKGGLTLNTTDKRKK
jgi:hypothetical protein